MLGVLFHVSDTHNRFLKNILDSAETVKDEVGDASIIRTPFAPNDLLPTNRDGYYRYEGSLTTPSCDEAVIWTVLTESVPFAMSQVRIQWQISIKLQLLSFFSHYRLNALRMSKMTRVKRWRITIVRCNVWIRDHWSTWRAPNWVVTHLEKSLPPRWCWPSVPELLRNCSTLSIKHFCNFSICALHLFLMCQKKNENYNYPTYQRKSTTDRRHL